MLEAEKSRGDLLNHQLNENLAQVQQRLTELTDAHTSTIAELERLRSEQKSFREKEIQFQATKTELDHLCLEMNRFQDIASQLVALQIELDQSRQLLEQTRTDSSQQVNTLQEQIASLGIQADDLRVQLQQAGVAQAALVTEIANLSVSLSQLQAELEFCHTQAQRKISVLQDQSTTLASQVAELTEKLQITTEQLGSEKAEKQAIQALLDQTCQQLQGSQEQAAQELATLSAQVRKLVADLEARSAAIQALETRMVTLNTEKTTIKEDTAADQAQFTQQLSTLQNQLHALGQTHAQQTQELTTLTARLKQIDRALATPLGRLFARLQGLK